MGNMIQKVLIADDSAIARSIVRRVLEVAGFENLEIREADCGEKALEMLKQSPAELVLTDLNMPQMDGFQLLRRIKASPKLNQAEVIVISSIVTEQKVQELKLNGALEVFKKPLAMPEVCQFLTEYRDGLTSF